MTRDHEINEFKLYDNLRLLVMVHYLLQLVDNKIYFLRVMTPETIHLILN